MVALGDLWPFSEREIWSKSRGLYWSNKTRLGLYIKELATFRCQKIVAVASGQATSSSGHLLFATPLALLPLYSTALWLCKWLSIPSSRSTWNSIRCNQV